MSRKIFKKCFEASNVCYPLRCPKCGDKYPGATEGKYMVANLADVLELGAPICMNCEALAEPIAIEIC